MLLVLIKLMDNKTVSVVTKWIRDSKLNRVSVAEWIVQANREPLICQVCFNQTLFQRWNLPRIACAIAVGGLHILSDY